MKEMRRLNSRDWLKVGFLSSTAVPFIIVIFLKIGHANPYLVMTATGLSIVAAAYFLSWATESLQTVVSQAFALAVLALVEVLPEYSFEVILAYQRQLTYATATLTGANRLLMGFGWPLVYFVAFINAKRKGEKHYEIKLEKHHSVEVIFLLISSLYSSVIIIQHNINLFDSVILIIIYGAYIFTILHLPPERQEKQEVVGTGEKIVSMKGKKKFFSVSLLLLFGLTVILFGAEPFINSMQQVATGLGIDKFRFIQWFAPFLSEFPESLTAFIWASTIILASMGLANLISSKVNQWTLLVASIPIAYSISMGKPSFMPLDTLQVHEMILTTAQTIYGSVCLFGLRFKTRHAITLIILFFVQFFLPETRPEVASIYILMTIAELYIQRNNAIVFRTFIEVLSDGFRKTKN